MWVPLSLAGCHFQFKNQDTDAATEAKHDLKKGKSRSPEEFGGRRGGSVKRKDLGLWWTIPVHLRSTRFVSVCDTCHAGHLASSSAKNISLGDPVPLFSLQRSSSQGDWSVLCRWMIKAGKASFYFPLWCLKYWLHPKKDFKFWNKTSAPFPSPMLWKVFMNACLGPCTLALLLRCDVRGFPYIYRSRGRRFCIYCAYWLSQLF